MFFKMRFALKAFTIFLRLRNAYFSLQLFKLNYSTLYKPLSSLFMILILNFIFNNYSVKFSSAYVILLLQLPQFNSGYDLLNRFAAIILVSKFYLVN